MNKKIVFGFTIVLVVLLIWYLFFKKYDYIVTFKERTAPGTIYKGVVEWNENMKIKDSIDSRITSEIAFSTITQLFNEKNNIVQFDWEFEAINDSITNVTVGVVDNENSIYNRIMIPFTSNGIKQVAINKVVDFKNGLEQHLEKHKVKLIGIGTMPAMFCVYVPIESLMENKAQEMIAFNSTIMIFLKENNLKISGNPFVEVTSWDISSNKIKFNYCFPVDKIENLPNHPKVKFKQIESRKTLNATYFGNYRTSDRAWFALHEFALRNNIKINNKPVEIFFNNPYMGGNELEWRAEIFIPIEE